MMNGKQVEQFYNCYKHNLYEIKYIEKTILAESYDYEKWELNLREKSQILRELYESNEKLLNDTIRIFMEKKEITDEVITALLQHIMYFVYEDHMDYEVTVTVLNFLEQFIENEAQDWQKIKYYYIRGLMLSKGMINNYEYPWYEKMQEVCAHWMQADRNGTKERMLDAYIHRAICQLRLDNSNVESYLKKLDEARVEWNRPETLNVINEIYGKEKNAEKYVQLRLELIDYLQMAIVSEQNLKTMPEERIHTLYEYLEKAYVNGRKTERLNGRIFLAYHQVRLYLGRISKKEYVKALETFEKPSPYIYPDDMNFEMNMDDLYSCLEKNRLFCNSFTYAMIISPEKIRYNPKRWKIIYKEIEQYIGGFVPMENGMDIDRSFVELLKVMSNHMKKEEMFRLMEIIMLHRQLPTAIHLSMVSRLVDVFITHIVEEHPELVVGLLNTKSVEEVCEKKDEIIEYVVKAGLCHDIGKLHCSDIINLQSRRILDEEFGIIKSHPLEGYKIVNEIETFKPYADIVLGHHMYADRSKGYPQDMEIQTPEYAIIVELITICDSVDAATDILGRNYTEGKTFINTVRELQEQKGTRYSKILVDILSSSPELMDKMKKLTDDERATVYHDLYVRRVKPLTHTKQYVEKNFKPYTIWYKQAVWKFIEEEIPREIVFNYSDIDVYEAKYIIVNGEKEIIGVFLGDEISVSDKKGVLIKLILIRNTSRHVGLGKKLLEYVETKLQDKGYEFVAMERPRELSVMERFMWINGYRADETGMLVKNIGSRGEK